MTIEAEQSEFFGDCSTLDEICFAACDTFDTEGLQEMLEECIRAEQLYRETLNKTADKLS